MVQENYRKIKLLKLLDMLRQDTDEAHPLTTNQICCRLESMGIICDRRTLSKDIATLNEQGYEVMSVVTGREKAYYVEERSFSVPELKIMIDAIQAASFITESKSVELIEKIASLGGGHRAEILKGNMVCFNTRKHSNEHIYYNVNAIENAILDHKKILFRYYDLDENCEKIYRRGGHRYVVEPIALVFSEDNYYLMVYSARHDGTATYRVDRMENMEVIDDPISNQAIDLRSSIAGYTEQAFKMYVGVPTDVVLEFDAKLIGVVYDKFGEATKMIRINESTCVATVTIQESPTFWGWLFQFAGQMKILSPSSLAQEYVKRASMVCASQH